MAVTGRDKQILWGKAAGRCSHPSCRKQLIGDGGDSEDVLVGEVAHIVAQSASGPRGEHDPPGSTRDGLANLILLCPEHHTTVDRQPAKFPVAKLVQWKKDHEDWVVNKLSPQDQFRGLAAPAEKLSERVYTTLLSVQNVPKFVYLAECASTESEIKRSFDYSLLRRGLVAPFIVRGGNLLTFCDLDDEKNPFARFADPYSAEKHNAEDWWNDPDLDRNYMALLNRSLNKLTGRRGLNLDTVHGRYYFENDDGHPREVEYMSIGGRRQTRLVAWQPTIQATGEKRHYWEHLASALRFRRTSERSWCLSIRPERRFTHDGKEPLTPKGTGRRSTSRKSHMYNIDVLGEVHFWRHYLSDGKPRIIVKFGKQSLVVSTNLLATNVCWPQIQEDTHKRLKIMYNEDLFSLADYNEAMEFEEDEALSIDGDLEIESEYDDEAE